MDFERKFSKKDYLDLISKITCPARLLLLPSVKRAVRAVSDEC